MVSASILFAKPSGTISTMFRPVHTEHQYYCQYKKCYVDGQMSMHSAHHSAVKNIKGAARQRNVVALNVNGPLNFDGNGHRDGTCKQTFRLPSVSMTLRCGGLSLMET